VSNAKNDEPAGTSAFAQLCRLIGELELRLQALEGPKTQSFPRRPRKRRRTSLLDQTKGQVIPFRSKG
jgi:hypothetical protein